ncbi:MAG: Ig-like domain-containing protein, partial [Actinomycetota bacterium]|nr:Ig-like domain-containing protein [Actinomycetota bacterium]
MRLYQGRVGRGAGLWAKLVGIALTLMLLPLIPVLADHAPPSETHVPAGSGQLQGTELVEELSGFPCFRTTRTLFGLRGTGTFEGRTQAGNVVVYNAQIGSGQTLYADGPLQVQLENSEVYYHGIFGTHGTEAGGGAGCSPTTAGSPVPADFRVFAAEATQDSDGDNDVDLLTGAAWVYRVNEAGEKVPCVGRGTFARNGGTWTAEWTLSADCVVVANQAGTSGTGTAPRGTFVTHHGGHAPCFDPPCVDNLRVGYEQYLPKPGPFLRLTGPASAAVGCDPPVTVTARLTVTGWPEADVPVTFSVSGPGAALPPGGTVNTDQNGEAAFAFTAATRGDYTVTATASVDGEEVSATHMVRFTDPPPLSVALAAPDNWQTEEPVTVTATVNDACGPLPGAQVDFSVEWPSQDRPWTGQATPKSGSALSGADGRASFTFSGDRAGDYRVTASTRLPTDEQASDTHTVHLEIRNFKRDDAITLPSGESALTTAVVDPAGRYAYFGTFSRDQVVKVDLTSFERMGSITLQRPDGASIVLRSAVIDPVGRYAYFAGDAEVFKVDLERFEQVDRLVLEPNEEVIESGLIDPAGRFAYFGVGLFKQGKVVKVDLATFTRVGAIDMQLGDRHLGDPQSAVMDPAGRYAYFGTNERGNGGVVKVDLATFEIADDITLPSDEYWPASAVIAPSGDFAYFGASGSPGRVVKVDLRNLRRVGAITFASGENLGLKHAAVIDPAGDFAYFGGSGDLDATFAPLPAAVVKVDLRIFERVHAITLAPDSSENRLTAAVIDPGGDYAYFGTDAGSRTVPGTRPPDRVVKVQLKRPPNSLLVAGDDAYDASAGATLSVAAPGVLGNDDDTTTSEDKLAAGQATDPAGGSVSLNPDGSFIYTPDPGFAGSDTFTYTATNGMDYSAPATVSLSVAPPKGLIGSSFGYHADNITLFGGAQSDTGPTPTVALAADASNSPQTATAPTGLVQYGPATLFTSDQISVSTSGSLGPGGSVTSTSSIDNINKSTQQPSVTGGEIFTADNLSGTATADAGGVSGATTVTNGTVDTHSNSFNCSSPTTICGGHTHDTVPG